MSFIPLRIEIVLKLLAGFPDRCLRGPVLVAILEDKTNISLKFLRTVVVAVDDLGFDGREIHRTLDDIEIVGDIVHGRVDGMLERADETGPEARARRSSLAQE
jgi:hypothetical protein